MIQNGQVYQNNKIISLDTGSRMIMPDLCGDNRVGIAIWGCYNDYHISPLPLSDQVIEVRV
jgi:hypothetical protein